MVNKLHCLVDIILILIFWFAVYFSPSSFLTCVLQDTVPNTTQGNGFCHFQLSYLLKFYWFVILHLIHSLMLHLWYLLFNLFLFLSHSSLLLQSVCQSFTESGFLLNELRSTFCVKCFKLILLWEPGAHCNQQNKDKIHNKTMTTLCCTLYV